MRAAILIVCAVAITATDCSAARVPGGGAFVRYEATQDFAQLSPRPPAPLGGRIDHGRLAIAGSARAEHLTSDVDATAAVTSDTRGAGLRSPVFSGDVMAGYGVASAADIYADCSFGESASARRRQSSLLTTNTHTMALWRCVSGGRWLVRQSATILVLAGASLGIESVSVRRNIAETIDRQTFGAQGIPVGTEQLTTTYAERFGRVMPSGWLTLGILFEPREWLRFELGVAAGLLATYARAAQRGSEPAPLFVAPLANADRFDGASIAAHAQGWLGAAIGPPWMRFALRLNAGTGATNGLQIGGEAGLVFSPQVHAPAALPRTAAR